MSNEWFLIRFSNTQDKTLVFERRPWFVNGLTFVVLCWKAFFDPYHS